ncbi:Na+/H+ antiporter [uncultured Chitinophaga sp.]|uniref:Na+/H+ antiporter n=1 Tax=uncultured Chitinophaga sp. TaxID=339340 RepID=UPI002606ACF1|nr:Na+/H+ antiporter [uncultured Chitinophaga sp.]
MHNYFGFYLIILLAILLLFMAAQRLRIAYPIVLVLGGLVISFIPGLPEIRIDPELIFVIFLPPLLYEAAWYTSWKDFWKWRRVISSFAFPIVLLTSSVIAMVAHYFIPGFSLALGFLLGGIISPPDAVSATSVMRYIKVPRRVVAIIEGESLLNDAASLIVFRFALVAVETGAFVFSKAAGSFVLVIVMGILIGLAIALVFYAIYRWLPTTPNVDILLSFIAPYMMYIVAEKMHFSGVLAVVSGALFLSANRHVTLSFSSRLRGDTVWSTVGFVLNGLVFMLIGLELPFIVNQLGDVSLGTAIFYGIIISVALMIIRMLSTFGAAVFTVFISRFITTADPNPGWKGPILLGWAGMRGVVSLAAALSIPLVLNNGQPFPQRNLILFITFTVILITLVFQGLTLPWLVRIVKMEDKDLQYSEEEQDAIIRKKLHNKALAMLNEQYQEELSSNELLQNLKTKMESVPAPEPGGQLFSPAHQTFRNVYTAIIREQRQLLQQLNKKEALDEELIRKHIALLDLEEEKMRMQIDGQDR